MNWISVEDREPQMDLYVLVHGKARESRDRDIDIFIAARDEEGEWHNDKWQNLIVTHWMPLPEPPEEEHCNCCCCKNK